MFNSLTEKLLIAAGTFTLAIALITTAVSVIPGANAQGEQQITRLEPAKKPQAKSRTVDIATCSTRSWPHYDAHCLTDYRTTDSAVAKPVRVISLR